ncbi:MAG: AAA family ATPase [Prevotella sp.]|nr:AAA family ATPase [Prevotella sp.]
MKDIGASKVAIDRKELYNAFQKAFPLESLKEMPLEKYTNLNRDDSFCYWVEIKTQMLGSIKGGSSSKFGIYQYASEPKSKNKLDSDDTYAWYSLYEEKTAQTAYEKVRTAIVRIATYARNGEFKKIDDITVFGDVYKWKIAFLYSNLSLIPIYRREWLAQIASSMGMKTAEHASISELQAFLMSKKGDTDLFAYYDHWLAALKTSESPMADIVDEENSHPEGMLKPAYSKTDFLGEVYLSDADFDRLHRLLLCKKNVILQGAPGVGKTFAAKRLAYAMMGEKDDERVEMVQFHQNYTYEDFIMGYKPTENGGFTIKTGLFYKFCKRAADDTDNPYFFIIDEINRGNLSKIFGELLMLIENGYRNKSVKLAYNGESFYVPDNLYIIGMMNTADRSLAMIDYALRRRFSFFDMRPAFDSAGFIAYQKSLANKKFDDVIEAVKQINEAIRKDDSLGSGFCIGHSYFCNQTTCDEAWLSDVVDYDLTPMLREYWFDNDKKFQEESERLKQLMQ